MGQDQRTMVVADRLADEAPEHDRLAGSGRETDEGPTIPLVIRIDDGLMGCLLVVAEGDRRRHDATSPR